MYPRTDFATEFPRPELSMPWAEMNGDYNTAAVAHARGEKTRSRRILTKIYHERLQARHQVNPAADPQAWLRHTAWCAHFAVRCNQPAAAARLAQRGLQDSAEYPRLRETFQEQLKALQELQETAAAAPPAAESPPPRPDESETARQGQTP